MKKCWPVVLGTFCSWERANETSNLPEGKKLTPITEGLAGHDSMPPHARIPNICSVKKFFDSFDSWRFRESTTMPMFLLLFSYRN